MVDTVQRRPVDAVTVAWLVGIARHKLADHWRATQRDQRRLRSIAGELDDHEDPWDDDHRRDRRPRHPRPARPAPPRRVTFRYLDGLPVRQVADLMDRTEHATEALLVRARRAFRTAYDHPPDNPHARNDRRRPAMLSRTAPPTPRSRRCAPPTTPIEPDPEFRASLRRRLDAAAGRPEPTTASTPRTSTGDAAMSAHPTTTTAQRLPGAGAAHLTPYLIVDDAQRAIDWYRDRARRHARRRPDRDGRRRSATPSCASATPR